MFILEEPYISDFLISTLSSNSLPVLDTVTARKLSQGKPLHWVSEKDAIENYRNGSDPCLYSTSENAIGWISKNLSFSDLPRKIELFKDKSMFRDLIQGSFPDFEYQVVTIDQLTNLSPDMLPFPLVIKPVTGFFSIGVFVVNSAEEWHEKRNSILLEFSKNKSIFPIEVINSQKFIIEQYIPGKEYAIDAYFDQTGNPCVLNILEHMFSSASDVRDRIYLTSKYIIEKNLERVSQLLKTIGNLAELRNFPVHLEVRLDQKGNLQPIELNPMRFGGWCSTPDLAFMAYGINPYEAFSYQQRPNWEDVLKGKDGKIFSLVILDTPAGIKTEEIKSFDYEKLLARFEKPIELRKIDIHQYPVFGFLFLETRAERFGELDAILKSDMKEFITKIN